MELKKLFNARKITLYWILALIYLSFIGLQLGRMQSIADFNYSLHEIMYLPFTIATFVLPVLLLIYIFLSIKYLRKRERKKVDIKKVVQSILIISSIVIIVTITEYQFQELSTGGVYEVQQKLKEGNKYYLIIEDRKIRVSYNEFHLTQVNQQYLISFVWNKRTPDKGKVETISPLN